MANAKRSKKPAVPYFTARQQLNATQKQFDHVAESLFNTVTSLRRQIALTPKELVELDSSLAEFRHVAYGWDKNEGDEVIDA